MTLVKDCVATSSYRTFDGECRAHLHVSLPDGPEKDAVQAQTCYNKCLAPGTFAAYESSGPPTFSHLFISSERVAWELWFR